MAVHEHVCIDALQFFIGSIIECFDSIDSVDTSHRGCIEEVALLNRNRLGLDVRIADGLETISEVCGTRASWVSLHGEEVLEECLTYLACQEHSNQFGDWLFFERIALEYVGAIDRLTNFIWLKRLDA